ncbi:MAG: molybdopterin-dependent oxidoreductase [Candidatus Pacearchaeota archaeon]|nr:molybdopterin-dependent oxidoreductase [Candidatus Pacearchaeota archaeon]
MKNASLILIIILIFLGGFFVVNQLSTTTKKLSSVEVREYQGQDLSSIYDFRENSIKGVQYIDINDYQLEITGFASNPKNYTYDEILNFQNYQKVVTLDCVEGWSATILWRGILMRDLLDEMKPQEDVKEVIFYAYDGYSTAFPIDYFYDNDIIMAFEMNNQTIIPERGFPFQLVAEDKWGYKWIKWITKIELSKETGYEGYWEKRGYSMEGNLDEYFFD